MAVADASVHPAGSRAGDLGRTEPTSSKAPAFERGLARLYRPVVRWAARAVLEGRRVDLERPERGRLLRAAVDRFLDDAWDRLDVLLREEDLRAVPTWGNRHNVFLGALTVASYHALLDLGIERRYAMDLFADVGWKIYAQMVGLPLALARLRTRDPQRRMDFVLRGLLQFPFSAPGRPGYEVRAWAEPDAFHTHWTYCAPLGFVKRHVERHGDRGEVEAFYRSWCQYDWPAADILAGGKAGEHGHYERPHTLSRGDSVCDMCWSASRCRDEAEAAGANA